MKLSERLEQSQRATGDLSALGTSPNAGDAHRDDPLVTLEARVQQALAARVGPTLFDMSMSPAQLAALVDQELAPLIEELQIPLTIDQRDHIVAAVTDQVLGYGPLEAYLKDPTISEIMVNGLDGIYVEREGRLVLTDGAFLSEQHILRVIDRIVASVGRRIDEASPMVDARLADGSRVNAIISPLAIDGPQLTIRRFAQQALTLDDLVRRNTMTREVG